MNIKYTLKYRYFVIPVWDALVVREMTLAGNSVIWFIGIKWEMSGECHFTNMIAT